MKDPLITWPAMTLAVMVVGMLWIGVRRYRPTWQRHQTDSVRRFRLSPPVPDVHGARQHGAGQESEFCGSPSDEAETGRHQEPGLASWPAPTPSAAGFRKTSATPATRTTTCLAVRNQSPACATCTPTCSRKRPRWPNSTCPFPIPIACSATAASSALN